MELVIGLKNGKNMELKTISSSLLLEALAEATKCGTDSTQDGLIFKAMTATDPNLVSPDQYKQACEQLGLVNGFINQVIS